jgi:cysteinyl-tRNA synthetase
LWFVGKDGSERDETPRQKGVENRPPPREFTQRGGGSLAEDDMEVVYKLLEKRDELKQERRFDDADSIRDGLLRKYGISIDDANREWRIRDCPYVMSYNSQQLDEEIKSRVQQLVDDRALARIDKDYTKSDSIQEELLEQYGVQVDDRVREWYVEG